MVRKAYGLLLGSLVAGLLGGFAASFIIGAPIMAQEGDIVVRAQQFQLIDAHGRTRASLAFSSDAQPYLRFSDENEARGVWIGISQETGMAVRDADGRTLLVLSIDDRGQASLIVSDRDHNTRTFQTEHR
jgi:hypothetical protein